MPTTNQTYEPYWQLTLAYTDFFGSKFKNSLRTIVDFIDANNINEANYTSAMYGELQQKLIDLNQISDISIRKVINTYVKLGFINYSLAGYHPLTKKYLIESDVEKQKIILSQIIYENSSFNRSIDEKSNKREINFLFKTLAYSGPLNEEDRIALMLTDIGATSKGFLSRSEIEAQKRYARNIVFDERKYNQISYLSNILGKIVDVHLDPKTNILYMSEEDIPESMEELEKRDPYLHRIYKANLKEESVQYYNKEICYLEKLEHPSLVASHIKPFIKSLPSEQYDKNNGFLLSRSMDALFDKGYITFSDDGRIIVSNRISLDLKTKLLNYSIDQIILNPERLSFLKFHRENVFK